MKRLAAMVMAGTLLGGCAGRYLPLYVARPPAADQTTQTRIVATLTDLSGRAETLSRTYQRATREADLSQLPLIGAAVALGLVALNKPDNAAKTLGRIGLGVGAYTATRSALAPSGGPEVLLRGVLAINCVVDNGSSLVGAGYDQRVLDLRDKAGQLAGDAAKLAADADRIVIPASADEAKAIEALRVAAKIAVAGATPALDAVRVQLGAYQSAPAELNNAASAIFTTLAARTSVREVIDSADLARRWTSAATIAPKASLTSQNGGAFTNAGFIDGLQQNIAAMVSDSAVLAADAAGLPFSASLKEVAKCPTKI